MYDRRGRRTQTKESSTLVETDAYDDVGNLLTQTYSAGPLNGFTVTNSYDSLLRRTNLTLISPLSTLNSTAFSYDSAGRLLRVSDGTNSATYGYVANSPLVGQILFTNNGALRMTTTKQYDLLNRLTNISSSSSSFTSSFAYAYNSANQRTRRTETDSAYWVNQYDSLGQVVSGKKYWSDGTPVAGQQFDYAFDDIGNRQSTQEGGDHWGANLRYASYSANILNQYTTRTVPSYFNDLGSANSNATVTLWSADGSYVPTYRRGDYFRAELPVTNASSALWLTVTNLAVLQNGTNTDILTNDVGNAFVPATPESFTYDADGNLTSDGRWTNHWDAENRLISIESLSSAPTGSKRKLLFTYDHSGRRIRKQSYTWTSAWSLASDTAFLYEAWNLIAEIDVTTTNLVRSYAWGLDLSGTIQGSGGVGGLLWVNDAVQAVHFGASDANGNVTALASGVSGNLSATYEYSPFGQVIRATGSAADANHVRFSTKYQDDETELLYYGYRFNNPSLGRWLSRDPIAERGGPNIYCFVGNNAQDRLDVLGRNIGLPSCGYGCIPVDFPGPPADASTDCGIWTELLLRWRSGKGWAYALPEDAVVRMLDRGQNVKDIESMKGILRSKCLFKSKRNSSTLGPSIVTESFTSDGAEREAWFLGGHKRTITGHLDCCTGKGRICLEITDRWDYDEQDKLPPLRDFGGFCKTLSTKALGAILDFGELDWPAPVPVTGKTCIDFGP